MARAKSRYGFSLRNAANGAAPLFTLDIYAILQQYRRRFGSFQEREVAAISKKCDMPRLRMIDAGHPADFRIRGPFDPASELLRDFR